MNEQNKRERVIRALKCRSQSGKRYGNPCEETGACEYAYLITDPDGEPYYPFLCNKEKLCNDAIELLKAKGPRVLTLDEIEDLLDAVVWFDNPNIIESGSMFYAQVLACSRSEGKALFQFFDGDTETPTLDTYNIKWRCWTSRPTKEQREATPWTE